MQKFCALAVLLILLQTVPGSAQTFLYDSYQVSINPPTDTWEPDYMLWVRGEYLLWHLQSAPLPSLVTTGGVNQGALGFSDTRVLYGGDQDFGLASGGRIDAGLWFNRSCSFGMESSYFQIAGLSRTFSTASSNSILSIPFNSASGSVAPITNPATPQSGGVQFSNEISFLGGDITLLFTPVRHDLWEINYLLGYQSLFLQENLNGNYNTTLPAVATTNIIHDFFGTQNVFYGMEAGMRGILRFDNLSLEATARVGLGSMLEIVNINGQTSSAVGGVPTVSPVGVYAQTSNSGHFNRNEFSIAPQAEVRLGWEITSHLKLSLGYDFLCVSSVVRPGNQINQNAGVVYTSSSFNTSWFNAQGVNFGVEIRY